MNTQESIEPTESVDGPKQRGNFLRPFGQTSLGLAIGVILLPLFLTDVVVEHAGKVGSLIFAACMALMAMLATTLGLLSLFGVGGRNGKAHRFAGFFGMILGGFVFFAWASLPFANYAARQAREAQQSNETEVSSSVARSPSSVPVEP